MHDFRARNVLRCTRIFCVIHGNFRVVILMPDIPGFEILDAATTLATTILATTVQSYIILNRESYLQKISDVWDSESLERNGWEISNPLYT